MRLHPTPQDIKYIKRYLEKCTPPELKLSDSRHNMIERILNPDHVTEMTLEEKMLNEMKVIENYDNDGTSARSSRASRALQKA